ncbi:hypothetical protein QBC34DRAFT_463724 [Podospora aff. communis PSN243]|uniref:Developmental regulatory protein wetA n=1 Tax=Podospora aff. communis PSN243 TaxID=3040156 RepID=A0AAV9GP23_9PEZI|nr:hypothetical protein QBC34DRAFT_463724 [Podospora aff. communis PSN243]
MASVQQMAYSSSEFSFMENKGAGGGFLWQDPHDGAGPSDLFDEFVVLDGADSSTPSTAGPEKGESGAGDLEHLRSAGAAVTPPLMSGAVGGQQQQQRQMRAPVAADAHHLDMIDMGGLPPNYREGPGKGSISDSELLKLEGLTMRSPRTHMGPVSSSVPPSPTRGTSSRKTGRLEALYVKARDKMALMQGKVRPQQPQLSTAKMEPVKRRAPSKLQFPASPPLCAAGPDGLPSSSMSGALPDGFPPTSGRELNTAMLSDMFGPDLSPLHTPLINGLPGDHPSFWPFADPSIFTSSSTDSFWVDPSDTMDIDDPNFFSTSFTRNANNRTNDFPLPVRPPPQHQHPSGLMIHMPQPRGPSSAVLHPSHQIALSHPPPNSVTAPFHYPPPPIPATPSRRGGQLDIPPRRHKPRAPSSGARHHHHPSYPSGASPRKPGPAPRSTSSSGSMPPSPSPGPIPIPGPRLHRRSASMQQLLRHGPHHPDEGGIIPQSALRKRKSWTTSRRVSDSLNSNGGPSPRKSLGARRASSSNIRSHNSNGNGSSADPSPNPNGAGASASGGFVNFTPSDHKVLMRGVAPSGSSKTKARRDREAMEQKRKLGEAVRLAVQAAGGDVTKLEEEGIVLGMLEGEMSAAAGGGMKSEREGRKRGGRRVSFG